MDVILVADFGSSNVRVNGINMENGEIAASYHVKYPLISTREGYAELDAEQEWDCSVQCVKKVMEQLKGKDSVCALTFSHIGSSLVPMDENFNAVYRCILGMDSRAGEEGRILAQRLKNVKEPLNTSFTCSEISTMAKIIYIQNKMPDIGAKTKYYLSIQQFILKKLGLPLVWDATEAGSHCCYDNVKRQWSEAVLEAVGISAQNLGEVVNSHEVVGTIARYGEVVFDQEIPVVIGGHDAVMGAVGLGMGYEGADHIAEVTGTVDVFCFQKDEIFHLDETNMPAARAGAVLMSEPGPVKNSTICMAGFKTAGAIVEWFLRTFCDASGTEDYKDLWSHVFFNGRNKVLFNPDFVNNRGGIMGLDMATTKYDIFQGCVETLTYELKNLLELAVSMRHRDCTGIRIGGGHANSSQWVQFRADVTGKVYERAANHEVSALGAGVTAAYGIGAYPSMKEAAEAMVRVKDTCIPNRETGEIYQELYREYIHWI